MNLTIPYELLSPAFIGAAFPFVLMPLTRLRLLKSKNGTQFLVATIAVVLLWIASTAALPAQMRPDSFADWLLSGMVLSSILLLYLEAWALLSRGYTLGMLLSLLDAAEPLDEHELARRYRGGDGLQWIMHHRLAGLLGVGLVRRENDMLVLSPLLGRLVAVLYLGVIAFLGLRRTG